MESVSKMDHKAKKVIQEELLNNSVKSAFLSGLLFFIVAYPELFKTVDSILSQLVGKSFTNIHLLVLFIHSILFGVLYYFLNRLLYKKLLD